MERRPRVYQARCKVLEPAASDLGYYLSPSPTSRYQPPKKANSRYSIRKMRLFYQMQAEFLAPVLTVATKRQSNHDFYRDHIMPFIEKSDDGFDKGSFGQVYQYKIHPNHLKDPEGLLKDPENPVGNLRC